MSVVVENLTMRYHDLTAVDEISFTAPTGAVTVILGPNGAGKTSTIEVCEGFRTPTSGHVRVLGLDPHTQHQELTQRMGVMLQGGGVYPSARVCDVLSHFCALHGKGVNAAGLMHRVGLQDRAKSTWRRLSGGEQQRLSLALALAADPEIVFLDEPTSGVDIEGRDVIREIIHSLATRGTTVVLATHEMAEAEKVASHAVLFRAGKVVADGPIESLLKSRAHLRFSSVDGISTAELTIAAGSPVTALGEGRYEVASASTPQMISRITSWLAEHNYPIVGIDMGTETLEDAYRRIAGGAQ